MSDNLARLVAETVTEVLRERSGRDGPGWGVGPLHPAGRFTAGWPLLPLEPCAQKETGSCNSCGLCAAKIPDTVRQVVAAGAGRVAAGPGGALSAPDLAPYIDHTLLAPDATREQVVRLCSEARQYGFASVCVNPGWVAMCSDLLRGSGVMVCTVVGFPLGATTTIAKQMETRDAIANGADEIDMVMNVGALKAGEWQRVRDDIAAVVRAAAGRTVKVILETGLLSDEEKVLGCQLAREAGASFVKTSTGFGHGGATVEDVALMRRVVGAEMGVKASGGVRDQEAARRMLAAGATRIGASASVAIVRGEAAKAGGDAGYGAPV